MVYPIDTRIVFLQNATGARLKWIVCLIATVIRMPAVIIRTVFVLMVYVRQDGKDKHVIKVI